MTFKTHILYFPTQSVETVGKKIGLKELTFNGLLKA
jgi:hypothetical protein